MVVVVVGKRSPKTTKFWAIFSKAKSLHFSLNNQFKRKVYFYFPSQKWFDAYFFKLSFDVDFLVFFGLVTALATFPKVGQLFSKVRQNFPKAGQLFSQELGQCFQKLGNFFFPKVRPHFPKVGQMFPKVGQLFPKARQLFPKSWATFNQSSVRPGESAPDFQDVF